MPIRFSEPNSKLKKLQKRIGKRVYSFNLPAGHSCPGAKECLSMVVNGKIIDGKHTKFRCYSASREVQFPHVFKLHDENFKALRNLSKVDMVDKIMEAIPPKAQVIRCHSDGDFFSRTYMEAWITIAQLRDDLEFYAYTKNLFVLSKLLPTIPPNFRFTASFGGKWDNLIGKLGLRHARVVYSRAEAATLGLPIDEDDFHAYDPLNPQESFALLIHGVQPAGSLAARALSKLRGFHSVRK